MKKYSVLAIILSFLIPTAIAVLIGLVIGLIVGKEGLISLWVVLAVLFSLSFYPVYMNRVMILFAKKTMEKNSGKQNFGRTFTFTNKNTGTCGCVFRIDESSGRVAYVSAKDLVDINSSYMKGPFGGTRYVYFTFCYKNKRIKIPTFTSRNMYSLGSSYVQEALVKAQDICNLLLKLQ